MTMGSSNLLLNFHQSKGLKCSKKAEPVQVEDLILSVSSGPDLNEDLNKCRTRSHVSLSSECILRENPAPSEQDLALRRKSESSLMDVSNSVEALTRCIQTINMQKAANRKLELENLQYEVESGETELQTESKAAEISKIGDAGRPFNVHQQVTTPAMKKLNHGSFVTASCKSAVSNKGDRIKGMSNANGDGDYIQPNLGNARSRTSTSVRSRPSKLGPFLTDAKDNQRSPPPIDSVTMIYKKLNNNKPSVASIQVQQLETVELNRPQSVAKLLASKMAAVAAPHQSVKPPGLGLRTAIKLENEKIEGRQHGSTPSKPQGGSRYSGDSNGGQTSLNAEIGGRNFPNRCSNPQETNNGNPPSRKLKIRGLRNFVEKRRPGYGPPLWARQFPNRSKFHPDSYLYEFEGPTAPKRPVEAMNACPKKCGRCRACGVFSESVCRKCGNCPIDCKCGRNGNNIEEDEPGPEYFLSQILGSGFSQKKKVQVNNEPERETPPIFPRSRNLNNITSSNNPLKICESPVNEEPKAPPVIATGYNTYAPVHPPHGIVPPGVAGPFPYPGYGYPYYGGPPAGPVMPLMYPPPGVVPLPVVPPPPTFYAPYPPPSTYPVAPPSAGPPGGPSSYPPQGPVY